MKLHYAKLNPSGNTTILVTTPAARAEQPGLAARLMALLDAEQVGFVESATLPGARVRLQMMGGEFCGNASMSLSALLARDDGLAIGGAARIALEVSGAEGIVQCRVIRTGEAGFTGATAMPLPEGIEEAELPNGARAPLVRFPGIAHWIVPEGTLSPAGAEREIGRLCEGLDVDALGLLMTGADGESMRPLVYVRGTGSAVWEQCCGSGAAALAACAALREGCDAEMRIQQPGGTIAASAKCESGAVREIEIRGPVRMVREGWLEL